MWSGRWWSSTIGVDVDGAVCGRATSPSLREGDACKARRGCSKFNAVTAHDGRAPAPPGHPPAFRCALRVPFRGAKGGGLIPACFVGAEGVYAGVEEAGVGVDHDAARAG